MCTTRIISTTIRRIEKTIFRCCHPHHNKGRFDYQVGPVTNKKRKRHMPLQITITDREKVKVTLAPNDGGVPPRPAPIDGVPTWELVSGNATVEPAADGMSAELISSDDPGNSQFLVTADADLGTGFTPIADTIDLVVTAATAQNVGLSAGVPEPK